MSEEEKKAIERTQEHLTEMLKKYEMYNDQLDVQSHYRNGDIKIVLNLIEKQQKELNNLKEIEQLHQEENGKLRVEFEKVYEDNLTLAKELEQKEQIIKRLEQDVEGYRDLSKQIQADYSKQIREYEEGYNE